MALEIVQILASGTFGHVAVVRDDHTGHLLAAKVLREAHASNPKLVKRLRDEASLLNRVRHPNVVSLAELREIGGHPVLLMEWIRGVPLQTIMSRNPRGLDPADVCQIVRLTTEALDVAWNTPDPGTGYPIQLIHRDLKPSNLLLSVDGELKIVDLGIAKGSFSGKESETVSVVLGAHGYLAPERLDGAEDTQAGDVFALGCIFFELLTGRKIQLSLHPQHHAERMARHLMHLRPKGVSPPIVEQLAKLIAGMAAYEMEDRPSHRDVLTELLQLFRNTGWQSDLQALAERDVVPALLDRKFLEPRSHPAWNGLAFLETPTGTSPNTPPPRIADAEIRDMLKSAGWHRRLPQLHRMLAVDPSWTEAPFLEALDEIWLQQRPGCFALRFRRAVPSKQTMEQVAAILRVLESRPSDAVRRRAWRWVGHQDAEVDSLARQLYGT